MRVLIPRGSAVLSHGRRGSDFSEFSEAASRCESVSLHRSEIPETTQTTIGCAVVYRYIFFNECMGKICCSKLYTVDDELSALKEEFTHHQDKLEEYMSLLTDIETGGTEIQESWYSICKIFI